MSGEKKYTAQQAAQAVLKKAQEVLKEHPLIKKEDEGHEGNEPKGMALNDADNIARKAKYLHELMCEAQDHMYEPWVLEKLAVIKHYLSDLMDYIAPHTKSGQMDKSEKHKHIGWDKLESKLEGEGYSKKVADKINGSIKAKVEKSEMVDQKRADGGEKSADKKADKDVGMKKDESMAGNKKAPSNSLKPKIAPNQPQAGESEHPEKRIEAQIPPGNNPKENAEGNNPLAGSTPTQTKEDGKNEPGYDEMNSVIKLAKFMGHRDLKKSMKMKKDAQTQAMPDANVIMKDVSSDSPSTVLAKDKK